MHIPDNYDAWEAHEREQEAGRAEYPVCAHCAEAIMDDYYYEIHDRMYHEDCAKELFRKDTDDYEP